MINKFIHILFCFICCSITLSAQSSNNYILNAKLFTPKQGLSHRYINSIVKDNRGVIWLGTKNGLNRFDGKYFKVFSTENGLKTPVIDEIYPDDNILWCLHNEIVNHQYKGVTLFDWAAEKSLSLSDYFKTNLPFEEHEINNIELVNQALYIYLTNDQVYQYTTQNGFIALPFIQKGEQILVQNEDNQFLIWHEEKAYLKLLDKVGKVQYNVTPSFLNSALRVKFQGISTAGKCWLSYTTANGLELFNIHKNGVFEQPKIITNLIKQLGIEQPKKYHTQFRYVPQFDAFLYGNKSYFILFDTNGKVIYFNNSEQLKGIRSVKLVENNSFWLPCKKGFYQATLNKNIFTNYLANQNLEDFRSLKQHQNYLYFNSYSGVFKLNPKSNKPPIQILEKGLSSLVDRSNQLWISTYNLLVRYNLETGDTANFPLPKSHEIWSIYEDTQHRIWYSSKRGLFYLNPKTGSSSIVNYNKFSELANNTVYHFHPKGDGNVWLCTTSGLYELDIEKGIVARYFTAGKGKFQLPTSDIRHLYFDKAAQVYWLATGDKGLVRWNPETQESKTFPLYRLEANVIHAVYADDYGFLWLSTEKGIVQFNKESSRFKIFLPENGTSSHEFNRISHLKAKDGTIYFGSINGVTSFHPKDLVQTSKDKETVKVTVVELNQFLSKTGQIENISAQFYEDKMIHLRAGDRFFKLTLSLDDYTHNEAAIYYYKTKTDADWVKSKDNELSISNLPYGSQILQIKGLLNNGQFSERLEIPIEVYRPFYLTWWFGLSLFLFVIGLSIFYTTWKTRLLTIQKTVLEQEVQQRTAQIKADKKTIEVQAEKLKALDKTKNRFFANVSHELRTPITLIQGPIESVLNSQQLDNRNFTLLTKATQNTKNLLNLVNEILDLVKLDSSTLKLYNSKVVLYSFLRRIIANFQSLADRKNIQFTFKYELSKQLQVNLDKNKVEKILNNLLSNAFKFTPRNGTIDIQITETNNNRLLIKVQDSGQGIPSKDIPHVFNRFYQSSTNHKAEGGLGIGLSLSMEFVKLMNGKMWVESKTKGDKTGSIFYVELPKAEVIAMLPTAERLRLDNEARLLNFGSLVNENDSSNVDKQTILLVEDNLDLQEYISFLLSPHYNIITVENGQEAIKRLTSHQSPVTIHLIISDVMMPVMDGLEFLETLKANENWRTIPVIMLTARIELKDRLKALRIGVDDYLVKPFKEEELLVRIKNLLANYAIRQSTPVLVTTNDFEADTPEIELPTISEKDQLWLEKFEKLVLDTLEDSRFSVNYLAELQHITRRTLSSKVKKLTGLTTNQYIRTVRLSLAKELLENQSYPTVTEVANRVGFQKVEYFSKLYKESFGKLPSEYL